MLTPDDRTPSIPEPTAAPTLAAGQRIGDSERDRAVSALSEHFAVGRLDRAELDARLEAAYRATTLDQLVALFGDLPDPAPFRPSRRQRRAVARAARSAGRGGLDRWAGVPVIPVLAVVLVVVVLVVSEGRAFFVLPMMWFWLGMGRGRYHHPPRR